MKRTAALFLAVGLLGCGGGAPPSKPLPATVPVSGKVTLNGQPLPDAMVTFRPDGETKGVDSQGMTNAAGEFSLDQIRGGQGASLGTYRVTVSRFVTADGKPVVLDPATPPADAGAVESLPTKYSSAGETTLKATVAQTGNDALKFELKK